MIPPRDNIYRAKVSIWNAEAENGRCGHASLTLVKKTEAGSSKRHIGFWPKFPGTANPATLLWPVWGIYVREKMHDMMRESDDNVPYPPSNVYSIDLTEAEFVLMDEQLSKDKEHIKEGRVFFSLFPRFNLFNLVQIINEQAHTCLISQLPMEHEGVDSCMSDMHNFLRIENCATTVCRILKAGNINVKENKRIPWGVTPMGLGWQIENLSSHEVTVKVKRDWTQQKNHNNVE